VKESDAVETNVPEKMVVERAKIVRELARTNSLAP
jgi:hypothetical protein